MYHSLFIQSSVDGHLRCFHVLPIVNSAAMNNGVRVTFSIMAFLEYMPSSGIVGNLNFLQDTFNLRLPKDLSSLFEDSLTRSSLVKGKICNQFLRKA